MTYLLSRILLSKIKNPPLLGGLCPEAERGRGGERSVKGNAHTAAAAPACKQQKHTCNNHFY